MRTTVPGNFSVFDGSTLIFNIDGEFEETVVFGAASFSDPTNVSPQEIAATINSQVGDIMFAATYTDASLKQEFVEVYTNTFGPRGSISVVGGSANRFLRFPDTLRFGATISSQYRLEKISTNMKLYWAGGDNPTFSLLQRGDSVLLTGNTFSAPFGDPNNAGSFLIDEIVSSNTPASILAASDAIFQSINVVRYAMPDTSNIIAGNSIIISGFSNASNNGTFNVINVNAAYIDVASPRINAADDEVTSGQVDLISNAAYISFVNEEGSSTGIFNVLSTDDILFFRPTKKKLESSKRPATVWEINANEIVVTLPATPIVVRRSLKGSCHLQGVVALTDKMFTSSLNVKDASNFPAINGHFYLQKPDGAILRDAKYSYSVLSGLQLLNVTPSPDVVGDKLSLGVGPLSTQVGSNIITVTSVEPHGLDSGELVKLRNFDSFAGLSESDINVIVAVTDILTPTMFTITLGAPASSTTTNTPSVDKGEIYTAKNSRVMITNIQQNSGYVSAYVYDPKNAPYTISENQTTLMGDVNEGEFGNYLSVHNSDVFSESFGEIVIGYGKSDEEGPIKYIAKPSSGSIFIDPAYRYVKKHSAGTPINLLRSKFATFPSSNGSNYPVYVTDTITPRETLKVLIQEAVAAGITIRFIILLPDNVYNLYSLYEL
jgi:hypothetical protein